MRFRVLFCTAVALSLVGCAGVTPVPTEMTEMPMPPAPTNTLRTPTLTALPDLQPLIVTLRLWVPAELAPYGSSPGASVLAQQLAGFSEAYPELQVEVVAKQTHGRGGLLDFLRTARDAAPSVLPDLVILDAADLEAAASSDLLQPLDDLLSPALAVNRFPFAIEMAQVQTQTMGFVLGAESQYLAYRPELFDSPIVSWTQIVSSPAPFLFPAGGNNRIVNDATLIQYMAAGGAVLGEDGNPTISKAALLSVFQFYSDCLSTGVISPSVVLNTANEEQAWELFNAGAGGVAVVSTRDYWLGSDETMAFAPVPTRDGKLLSTVSGWTISLVTNEPSRQKLATLLLDWLVAYDHNAEWTQGTGYLPGTRGALQLWDVSGAERVILANVLDAARPLRQREAVAATGLAIQDGLNALLRGHAGPEQAVDLAADSVGR